MQAASHLELGPAGPLRVAPRTSYGVVLEGPVNALPGTRSRWLDPVLADRNARESFFSLVDEVGVVVCRNLDLDPTPYRRVGGKRTKGRLSQGEYFHHDGCSTPIKPRVVEIRCPPQHCVRTMSTAIVPWPGVVRTMLCQLPTSLLRSHALQSWRDAVQAGDQPDQDWDTVQGMLNRSIRHLAPEDARAFFRDVDEAIGAFAEPWTLGESRFIANHNTGRTAQHRRACYPPWVPGTPNGHLLKRWPAEELEPATDEAPPSAATARPHDDEQGSDPPGQRSPLRWRVD